LKYHPSGLLNWGETGLALEDLEAGTHERLLTQPILAVETFGQEILAAGLESLLVYTLGSQQVTGTTQVRITSLALAGSILVACDGHRLYALDLSDPAAEQFHPLNLDVPVNWVSASPLFRSAQTVWVELADGQGNLLDIDPGERVSVVARYEQTPRFVQAQASGRLLVQSGYAPRLLEVWSMAGNVTA
jgi:hypothetical protein